MLRKNAIIFVSTPDDMPFYKEFPLPDEELIVVPFGQAVCSLLARDLDLITLDCGFAPQLGLSLVRDFKARFPGVPILFITGQSSEEIVTQAFRFGVRDYFTKPLPIFTVRDFMMKLLESKRSERSRAVLGPALPERLLSPGNLCQIGTLQPAVMRVVCYLESHYKEAVDLDQMAAMANLSKYHFVRLFRREVGMSPARYLKFVRVQRAKQLLKRADLKIFSVAMQTGFQDVSNFNKNFKTFEGCTPGQYRRASSLK